MQYLGGPALTNGAGADAFAGGAGGGLVLLHRSVYNVAGAYTWSKPADGAGNLLAGVGKLVIVRQQGGGGGGYSDGNANGSTGGTTSFGAYATATGGAGGGSVSHANGGTGSFRSGRAGNLMQYINGAWKNALGGGDGARSSGGSLRGAGGWAQYNASNNLAGSGGGEGGESYDVFKISDLTSTVAVTIGAGGNGGNAGVNDGGPGWEIVEIYGVLS